jgi:hypothetical protein
LEATTIVALFQKIIINNASKGWVEPGRLYGWKMMDGGGSAIAVQFNV